MGLVQFAIAFAAGFLTCLALAIATIFWAFSDRRVRDDHAGARDEQRKQRIA
ncbi:hypothetical protein [Streptomyces sp. AcH 505]|uniref:hypothetical protein n=1 Tax=Streptomyces sp. AcH 505 TaxID=352211 RepID=UPI0018E379C5